MPMEKKFKVMFWWGDNTTDVDKVVYVKTTKREKREIVHAALRQIPHAYPREYQVMVEEVDTVELYVVRITNSINANGEAWYYNRDGELFVVKKNARDESKFETYHLMGAASTVGYIPAKFCTVVNTFEAEDTF